MTHELYFKSSKAIVPKFKLFFTENLPYSHISFAFIFKYVASGQIRPGLTSMITHGGTIDVAKLSSMAVTLLFSLNGKD